MSIEDLSQRTAARGQEFDYLAKPVHPRVLLNLLQTLIPKS
jgi:hypothetical protein